MCGTSLNSLGLILWKINLSLLWKLIFSKRYHSCYPSIFFKAHISVMGNHWTIVFYHIIIRLILNIFLKNIIYNKKDTKFGSQNCGYQIWFCTRLITPDEINLSHYDSTSLPCAVRVQSKLSYKSVNPLWYCKVIWCHKFWLSLSDSTNDLACLRRAQLQHSPMSPWTRIVCTLQAIM